MHLHKEEERARFSLARPFLNRGAVSFDFLIFSHYDKYKM